MTTVEDKIKYIKQYVDDLSKMERQDILQNIINAGVPDSKIITKGDGTQIRFNDIPESVLSMIYVFIQTKIASKLNELEQFNS